MSLLATAVRALTLYVIVRLTGEDALRRPFEHLHAGWIAVVATAELAAFPAYVLAYRALGDPGSRDHPDLATTTRIVVAGFGPVAMSGGFRVDRRAWRGLEGEASAGARTGAMAMLEWAVLAPITAVAAIELIVTRARVGGSLLWPWVLGVPAAILAAGWATQPGRREMLARPFGRRVPVLPGVLAGLTAVRRMALQPRDHAGAWIGVTVYWAAEIGAFFAALRTAGLNLGVATALLAYATGYLASRRSLPLGGAGITEALLVYSLHELHEPLGPAVAAVLIYQVFNFVMILVPALVAVRGLTPALVDAERRARSPDA